MFPYGYFPANTEDPIERHIKFLTWIKEHDKELKEANKEKKKEPLFAKFSYLAHVIVLTLMTPLVIGYSVLILRLMDKYVTLLPTVLK